MPSLADLDRLKADLDALRPLAPEQEARVLQKFRLEWNYNSNAIEGNSLTLGETRSLLLHGLTAAGKPMRDHLDIRGHNEAVLWLEDVVRDERPLTEQFIRGMHEVLLGEPYEVPAQTPDGQPTIKRIEPGRYKTSPNNVLTATGEIFYFASVEETPARMTDLVDWYRAEEADLTLHPVMLAAEFHYRFVRIHPFDDGNGRMSRLLMNLILLRHGYPMTVIQNAERNRYLAALSGADAGEFEPFLSFITENVEASLRLMIRAARGESIEELSDLNKKWALLRKQVLTKNYSPDSGWGLDTQKSFYEALINFWLRDLDELVRQANDFFATSGVAFAYQTSNESNTQSQTDTIESTLNFAKTRLAISGQVFEELIFIFRWNGFKDASNKFNLRLLLEFKFYSQHFAVYYRVGIPPLEADSSSWPVALTSEYRSSYDHAQIHEINHQLANKVYDFIAAKVAEADAPPT